MVTIKCTVYEKHDLLRLLDYAKEMKIKECNEGEMTTRLLQMDIDRINLLKRRINGQYSEDYQQSSISYGRDHGTLKERPKDDLPKAPFYRT